MGSPARRRRICGAIPLGCALVALWPMPAAAETGTSLFATDSFEVSGDVRLVAVDGERSWVDGGFGKLRSGGQGEVAVQPQVGNASLVWKPQVSWSLGAVIVGSIEGGQHSDAGISQAYFTYHPMRSSWGTLAARGGLMWPPVSLEHEGADWHVRDSITPSAINSWIGEEVRPVAAEASLGFNLGEHKFRATAALIAANDTSGTLLTFRGWALDDRSALAFRAQPLPPLESSIAAFQAPFTHPLLDVSPGFARRPGYYAKFAWQPPLPLRIELFRYDNDADPQAVQSQKEWGWRTWFNNVGVVADLGSGATLRAQALQGRTRMGYVDAGRRWIDNRFSSAFVMLTRPFGPIGLSGRLEVFGTKNHGSVVDDEYDDKGWAAMVAAKRDWAHFTALVELLHVSSRREDREAVGLEPRQVQNQLQIEVRTHW